MDFFALEQQLFSFGLPRVTVPLLLDHPERPRLVIEPRELLGVPGRKRQRTIPTDRNTAMALVCAKLVRWCRSTALFPEYSLPAHTRAGVTVVVPGLHFPCDSVLHG